MLPTYDSEEAHFFVPILEGDLTVEVDGPGMTGVNISANTIEEVAASVEWKGSKKEKKHAPPPFALAQWAIEQQQKQTLKVLPPPKDNKVPTWGEHLFDQDTLAQLRTAYESNERIGIRVPMTIERKQGPIETSFFDVFLERDADVAAAEDHFVREGMTIPKMSTMSGRRGIRGLLRVDDKALSGLLGDAEGPAHTEWSTGEVRPEYKYTRWKRRIAFVKNGIVRLAELASPPPSALSTDWLLDIFALEEPDDTGTKKAKKKKQKDVIPPSAPPPSAKPQKFQVVSVKSGFRISQAGEVMPTRLVVKAAYDVPEGNPFSTYSPLDFDFTAGQNAPLEFTVFDADFERRQNNQLIIKPTSPQFSLAITGFDTKRDVIVRCEEEQNAETV